jgi:hypothetical protein
MELGADRITAFVDFARMFDVAEGETDPDSGSNGIDDGMTDILQGDPDYTVERELRSFVAGLNDDEKAEFAALVWMGRGDYEPEQWPTAVRDARARAETPTARYLLAIRNLGDLVAEGYATIGGDPNA